MKINMRKEVRALKKWLEVNQPSKMAYLLGYKSSQTPVQWALRNHIPEHQLDRVRKIINEGELHEQLTSSAG